MIHEKSPLTHFNRKYGLDIYNFSLPRETCHGKTPLCEQHCYGKRYAFLWPDVKNRYEDNLKDTRDIDFIDSVINQINRKAIKWIRVHTIGDYYSQDYLDKWIEITKACKKTRVMSYTRDPDLDFSRCPANFKVFFSVDSTTPRLNPTVKQKAYLFEPPLTRAKYDHMEPLDCDQPKGPRICSNICDRCKACWLGSMDIAFPVVAGQKSFKPDWLTYQVQVRDVRKLQKVTVDVE